MIAISSMFLIIAVFLGLIIYLAINGSMGGLITSVVIEVIIIVGTHLLGKFKFWKYGFKLKLYEIFKPNLEIRISASYLYRIEIKGKYLLVKNRKRNVFQPIGGVYKYYESAKNFLNEIEFKPDNKMQIDDVNQYDLRIRIKAKYITKFLDWFYSKSDREIDYLREFKEEVVLTKILSSKFENIKPKFLRSIKNKVEYSSFFNCYEIKPKDIIELELTGAQYKELEKLSNTTSEEYKFANEQEILCNGITEDSQEVKFGDHTKYIL